MLGFPNQVPGNENPSTLICFASKASNAGTLTSKLHIIELGAQPGLCLEPWSSTFQYFCFCIQIQILSRANLSCMAIRILLLFCLNSFLCSYYFCCRFILCRETWLFQETSRSLLPTRFPGWFSCSHAGIILSPTGCIPYISYHIDLIHFIFFWLQISQKYGHVYVITKLGLLFVYDLETARGVYIYRISPDPIILTAESSTTGGFYAINRRGQVLHATVNDATVVPFVSGQVCCFTFFDPLAMCMLVNPFKVLIHSGACS